MIAKAISETRRILRLTRKPKPSEYNESIKICGAGIAIIGFVGFAIFLIFQVLQRGW
ncbi:MAG: protein translocase SEC61 complex subunit gamma [Candidatus Altiarchaeota archaeon]